MVGHARGGTLSENDRSNVQLMALAPAMIDLCQALVACQEELKGNMPEILWRTCEQARALLAQIEEERP